MTDAFTAPLRIGILGAARIADDGIVDPAKVLGHELVAVAARDRGRAEGFAAERGVAKVHDTYQDVIDDPDVEVVYDALISQTHEPRVSGGPAEGFPRLPRWIRVMWLIPYPIRPPTHRTTPIHRARNRTHPSKRVKAAHRPGQVAT